jgi:nucleoside-diphosphate-sugar epimerase
LRTSGHDCDAPALDQPRVDFTDVDAVERLLDGSEADVLIHGAWYSGTDRIASPQNAVWVDHTRRVLESFINSGGRRIVTIGSCLEYESADTPLIEDVTPIRPSTAYGQAKADVAALAVELSATTDVSAVHARVGFVYGPGERPPRVVPALIQSLCEGKRFESTSGVQRRDYSYVGDVGRALTFLADHDVVGAVNVGSGSAIAVADLITAIAEELDAVDLLDLGALPLRVGDPDLIELSIQRLRDLGWQPEVDLAEGVRRTVRSMRPSPTTETKQP